MRRCSGQFSFNLLNSLNFTLRMTFTLSQKTSAVHKELGQWRTHVPSRSVRSTRNLEFKTTKVILLVHNKSSRPKLGAPTLVVSITNSQAHYSIQNTICQHLSGHQAIVTALLRAQGDHYICVIHTLVTRHWRLNMWCFVTTRSVVC